MPTDVPAPALWAEPAAAPAVHAARSLPAPAHGAGGLDTQGLLKALLRRWLLALVLGLLFAGGAAAAAWTFMPGSTYTAKAQVLVRTAAPRLLDGDGQARSDARAFQKTQSALVRSVPVLEAVLRDAVVKGTETIRRQADAQSWLELALQVSFQGEVMTIALGGESPKDLAAIVNAVVAAYMNEVVTREKFNRAEQKTLLEKLQKGYQTRLETLRTKLAIAAKEAEGSSPETMELKNQLAAQQKADVEQQYRWAVIERKKIQIELETLRRAAPAGPSPAALAARVEQLLDDDPKAAQLRAKVQQIDQGMANAKGMLRNTYAQRDPNMRGGAQALDAARRDLANYLAGARPALEQRARAELSDATREQRAVALAERLEYLRRYEELMEKEVNDVTATSKKTVETATEIARLEEEIKTLTDASRKVSQRVEQLTAELEAPDRIIPLGQAPVPTQPDLKKKVIVTAGAGMGTLMLVLLGVSYLEYRVRRIDSVQEVAAGLGLRLVGALPATPGRPRLPRPGAAAALEAAWRSRLNESVNAIRALLLRHAASERLQVILVTSATVGEGKTSLACHLATSLARCGRRTLLLDCDLRSPTAHRVFDLPLEPGLAEVLRGQVAPEDATHPIAMGELRMMTAGRGDAVALQALGLDRIREVIERLRPHHEFIIIDSPPVLPVADPLLIGQHADAALFSILREVSRVPQVHAACERMAGLGIRILGAVVAGAPAEVHSSAYSHYAHSEA
jgi:succinoglycan biosynthesis transport protein ExoP